MSEKDDGGPGPTVGFPEVTPPNGFSMRDWFAGMAMSGQHAATNNMYSSAIIAEQAYKQADAMLAERSRRLRKAPPTPETMKPPGEIHADPTGLQVRNWPEGSGT